MVCIGHRLQCKPKHKFPIIDDRSFAIDWPVFRGFVAGHALQIRTFFFLL